MRAVMVTLLVLATAGCAGTQAFMQQMEGAGDLRVEVPDSPGYDYRVTIGNKRDVNWDGDKAADRLALAHQALQRMCADPELLDETPLTLGEYGTGRARINYVMRFACRKKA